MATASSPDGEKESGPLRPRILIGLVIALVVIGALVVALDWKEARQVLAAANWALLIPALFFTGLSYLLLNIAFALVSRSWHIDMGTWRLIEIGFISTVLNHLVTTGGAAGYSVRVLLMRRPGTTVRHILAISVFHIFLSMLGLLALLPVATAYLFLNTSLSPAATAGLGIAVVVLLIVFGLGTGLVFSHSLRAALLGLAGRLWRRVIRRDISGSLESFNETMTEGVAVFRRRPWLLALVMGLIVADWASSMATLWLCFAALGTRLSVGVLLTGFTIGITAGVASMVPGGLGVQEGSMAGIYSLLGIPLHQSVLAAALFRVVYYLIPYVVSLVFYWHLLRQAGRAGGPAPRPEES